jgi:hypothetical protein
MEVRSPKERGRQLWLEDHTRNEKPIPTAQHLARDRKYFLARPTGENENDFSTRDQILITRISPHIWIQVCIFAQVARKGREGRGYFGRRILMLYIIRN